jgi:hypothetical protein
MERNGLIALQDQKREGDLRKEKEAPEYRRRPAQGDVPKERPQTQITAKSLSQLALPLASRFNSSLNKSRKSLMIGLSG